MMENQAPNYISVPLVDLGELGVDHTQEPSQQEWDRVIGKVYEAFSDVGCIFLTGHGVPQQLIQEVLNSGESFFKQSKDVKNMWTFTGMYGYIPPGLDTYGSDKAGLREGFSYKPEMYDHSLQGEELPSFMPAVIPMVELYKTLSKRLMILFALSLSKERHYFIERHRNSGTIKGNSQCRYNYYSVASNDQEVSEALGAHTDFCSFTLLIANDEKCLQIRDSNGDWKDVKFPTDAILLICGDILHYYSEKQFTPLMHRVVPIQSGRPPRCSFAYFLQMEDDITAWPPSDDSNSSAPPLIREYMMERFNKALSDAKKKS